MGIRKPKVRKPGPGRCQGGSGMTDAELEALIATNLETMPPRYVDKTGNGRPADESEKNVGRAARFRSVQTCRRQTGE